ncbi:MAG: amidohydrolase family protein [Aggregatilineales bacterium]
MPSCDLLIRNGTIYDGSGGTPFIADVIVDGDKIIAITDAHEYAGKLEIDAQGLAVAPGFINMLSWAVESLIEDGRAQSDIRQGVTLEVMGEATSWGPLNDRLKKRIKETQSDIQYEIEWDTLGEYLAFLQNRGVSPNITSFIGAETVRTYVLGFDDVAPTPEQLNEMKALVRQAMEEGAVGMSTALIYPPGSYATTEEITALCEVVAEYDGLYISHMRSESGTIENGLAEFLTILRQAKVRGEIYHLKIAGQRNWHKLDYVLKTITDAQAEGLTITADMYTYPAAGTGLNSVIPPWAHDGGHDALMERLKNPELRARIIDEMNQPGEDWENLYYEAGSPDNLMPAHFKNEALRHYAGKRLSEIAKLRGQSPEETALDLILEDDSRVGTVYFLMDEDNLRRQVQLPYVSFGSDAEAPATEGVFVKTPTHPRAYGTFARVIGRYVRDEGLISLEDAIHRLSALPAHNLHIRERGALQAGYFADIVIFDPAQVQDHATFTDPHAYSTGMVHVFVNGVQVLAHGDHTGALPGKIVYGPGYRHNSD